MTETRRISISIPTFNRCDMVMESFMDVYHDERVNEIVIVDDESDWGLYTDLKNLVELYPKIKLWRNKENRQCYVNKATSLVYSNNDFCILLDSDNKISKDYLDKIFEIEKWEDDTIYTPAFAFPNFDFRQYSGLLITKENIAEYIDKPMFETMCNAANYFVNKNSYLDVWDEHLEPMTSDSIYMISRWLDAGNKVQVVSGLSYFHRVHSGSHYQNYKHLTPDGFHESVLNKLRSMA